MLKRVQLATLAALAASLGFAGSAAAQGAPAALPMQGFLTDGDGAAIDGAVMLTLSLYEGEIEADPLYRETQSVMVDQGHFAAYLGEGMPVDDGDPLELSLFRDNLGVWVGIAIDGSAELPRFALGTVPYAAYAENADNATQLGGMPATDFAVAADTQARVTGLCPAGEAITAIAGDGTVTCTAVGTITGVTAGTGLTGGGTSGAVAINADTAFLQRRVSGTCPAGQAIRAISATGTVSCQTLVAEVNRTVVTSSESLAAGASNSNVEAECPAGRLVISGACHPNNTGVNIINQFPNLGGNAWRCGFHNTTSTTRFAFTYAVCMLP